MICLIRSELKKVWGRKSFPGLMALLIFLNLFFLWYLNRPVQGEPPLSAYRAVCRDISGMTEPEKLDYIQGLKEQTDGIALVEEVRNLFAQGTEAGNALARQRMNSSSGIYEKYYEIYRTGNYLTYTHSLEEEQALADQLYEEISVVSRYDDYIRTVQENSSRLSGISIFQSGGSEESFTSRNIRKSAEDHSGMTGENIRWVNVVVDMMLPQRATLFGWALLFPALYLLVRGVFQGQRRYFLWVGAMAGALPMVHTHSFLALGLVCGVWMVYSLCRELSLGKIFAKVGKRLVILGIIAFAVGKELFRGREDSPLFLGAAGVVLGAFLVLTGFLVGKTFRRGGLGRAASTWGVLLGVTCLLAAPQLVYWTFQQAGAGSFLRGHFGWVIGEDGYLVFYLKNLGLTALLALGGLLLAKGREFARYAPALAIWLLAELVEFQPNDYDNNKLLYPAFAFLCCAGAQCAWQVLKLLKSRKVQAGAGAGLVALTSVSAVLTMGREAVASYELFGSGALALSHWVEENVPAHGLFLTDTRHNNEIASLTGRDVVCGSPSYLYFHGLPYGKNQHAAETIYQNPEGSQNLVRELGVDYILVSDFERSSYQVNVEALDRLYPRVYDDGCRVLYQVTEQEDEV